MNKLWVVELHEDGWWVPTAGVGLTREQGRDTLAQWRRNLPDDKLRLRAYSAEDTDGGGA